MICTRDFATRENHWQITSLVTKKLLFTITHALFFIYIQHYCLDFIEEITSIFHSSRLNYATNARNQTLVCNNGEWVIYAPCKLLPPFQWDSMVYSCPFLGIHNWSWQIFFAFKRSDCMIFSNGARKLASRNILFVRAWCQQTPSVFITVSCWPFAIF